MTPSQEAQAQKLLAAAGTPEFESVDDVLALAPNPVAARKHYAALVAAMEEGEGPCTAMDIALPCLLRAMILHPSFLPAGSFTGESAALMGIATRLTGSNTVGLIPLVTATLKTAIDICTQRTLEQANQRENGAPQG